MFTGIIRDIGTVEEIRYMGKSRRVSIKTKVLSDKADIGNSVSVDGVCLTVVERTKGFLYFDVIGETLEKTNLGSIKKNGKVNLEPSLELKDEISGHLVSGHIDEVGTIKNIRRYGEGVMQITIGVSPKATSLLVTKGSVAVNGISLTVNYIGKDYFIIDIIPHTFNATTMGVKNIGDKVNIEFDLIGKYVLKNLSKFNKKALDEDFLKEKGFI